MNTKPHKEETKQKISASLKGHLVSNETRELLSNHMKGKHRSLKNEFPKGFTYWKGKSFTAEHKYNLSISHIGKTTWNKGIPVSESVKKRLSLLNKGKKLSIETREKISKTLKSKREQSHLWKGGATEMGIIMRSGLAYRLWRESVFERDNYTCVWCGAKNGQGISITLNADHIKPFSLYPELRLSINNGRTLCKECHSKTDTFMGRIKNYHKSL